VAVRAALGGRRRRLIKQFLAESVMLGSGGRRGGTGGRVWSTRALVAIGPASIRGW